MATIIITEKDYYYYEKEFITADKVPGFIVVYDPKPNSTEIGRMRAMFPVSRIECIKFTQDDDIKLDSEIESKIQEMKMKAKKEMEHG